MSLYVVGKGRGRWDVSDIICRDWAYRFRTENNLLCYNM